MRAALDDEGRPRQGGPLVETRQQHDEGSVPRDRWLVPEAAPDGSDLVVEDLDRRRWIAVVDRTPSSVVPAEYRLVLIAYARRMRADGFVSYGRHKLAIDLGGCPRPGDCDRGCAGDRKVQRALARARSKGLLRYLNGGYHGATTEYQASRRLHDVDAADLPESPPMPRKVQGKGDTKGDSDGGKRETPGAGGRETRSTSLRRETPGVSPREELQREPREHGAVEDDAADEAPTAATASYLAPDDRKSGNEKGGREDSAPLAAPLTIRPVHVCAPGCREAAA